MIFSLHSVCGRSNQERPAAAGEQRVAADKRRVVAPFGRIFVRRRLQLNAVLSRPTDRGTHDRLPVTDSRRWNIAGLFSLAVAAGACSGERGPWTVETASGPGTCSVQQGMTRSNVITACGTPTRQGDQPKRAGGPQGMCSAPCDLYAKQLLLYGCDGGLSEVEKTTGEWQHCVFQP